MKLAKLKLKKRDIAEISQDIEELNSEMTDEVVGGTWGGWSNPCVLPPSAVCSLTCFTACNCTHTPPQQYCM